MLSCAHCMRARYCSRACQKEDWPEHKANCNPSDKYLHERDGWEIVSEQ